MSSWTDFPKRYKFLSFEMNMFGDRTKWNRQTYSLLDWLGDLGGLTDALYYILKSFVTIYSSFVFQNTMSQSFIKVKNRNKSAGKKFSPTVKGQQRLMNEMKDWKRLPKLSFLQFTCY